MAYFAWLLSMSYSLAAYAWPVTLMLLAGLGISLYLQVRKPSRFARVPWPRVAIGFVFPPVILLCGTFWHATGENWTPRSNAHLISWVIGGLLGIHILAAALAARRSANAEWVVGTAGACSVWWSLGSAMVALMSVTGDWL